MKLRKKIVNVLKIKNKKPTILVLFLLAFSIISLIFFGAFSPTTSKYENANYFCNLLNDNAGRNYAPLICESKGDAVPNNTATEFRNLYGAFGNRKANFAGTVNADKKNILKFTDISSENLSILYVQNGFSNVEYNNHYKHEFYPIELMFRGQHKTNAGDMSFFYVSKSQADKIIETYSLENDYSKLLGKSIYLSFNDKQYSFTIANVFYDDPCDMKEPFFFNTLKETMGEFIVGYNTFPSGFKKQATFFMNKYEFQNEFYLEYIEKNYPTNDFKYTLGKYNLNETIPFPISFFEKNNSFYVLFLCVSIILIAISIFIIFYKKLYMNFETIIYFVLLFLIMYLILKIIYLICKNLIFFSPTFLMAFSIISLLFFIFYFSIFMYFRFKKNETDFNN